MSIMCVKKQKNDANNRFISPPALIQRDNHAFFPPSPQAPLFQTLEGPPTKSGTPEERTDPLHPQVQATPSTSAARRWDSICTRRSLGHSMVRCHSAIAYTCRESDNGKGYGNGENRGAEGRSDGGQRHGSSRGRGRA